MTEVIIIFFSSLLFARVSLFFFIQVKIDLAENIAAAQKEFYKLMMVFAWPWYASFVLMKITKKNYHDSATSLLLAFVAYWSVIVSTLLLGMNISPLNTLLGGGIIFVVWAGAAYLALLAVDNSSAWKILD